MSLAMIRLCLLHQSIRLGRSWITSAMCAGWTRSLSARDRRGRQIKANIEPVIAKRTHCPCLPTPVSSTCVWLSRGPTTSLPIPRDHVFQGHFLEQIIALSRVVAITHRKLAPKTHRVSQANLSAASSLTSGQRWSTGGGGRQRITADDHSVL
jgi:hypothetical protein